MSIEDTAAAPVMGQCSITGKMVPEDELVTIQGHRVCAEGKAILLERLKSGEAMPGEDERPTVLRRFGCIFLDGLIIGVPFAVLNGVVTAMLGRSTSASFVLGLLSLLTTTVQVVYFGQMHGSSGQTLGKKAGKLVVVNLDGSPISVRTGYIRALAYSGPGYLSGLAMLVGIPGIVLISSVAVGLWGLTDTLLALFDRSMQRSLHDRIAGTRVVEKDNA